MFMLKFPISTEMQIAAFKQMQKKPVSSNVKELLALITELENQAYEQGKADALAGKPDGITRLPAPLNCIKRVILTDGTVYDNGIYETEAPILTEDEMSAAAGFDQEKWRADYIARLDAKKKRNRARPLRKRWRISRHVRPSNVAGTTMRGRR